MAKVIDITDKLSFDENPKLQIKGVEIEVNADAKTVLTVMSRAGNLQTSEVPEMIQKVFTDEGQERLEQLHLKLNDYMKVLNAAVELMTDTGDGVAEGNGEDPTMT